MRYMWIALLLASQPYLIFGQTISEKKESFQKGESGMDTGTLSQLREVNQRLDAHHFELNALYEKVRSLYQAGASLSTYESLLDQIRLLKKEIADIQNMWRIETSSLIQNEEYALWHQPETTLQQLVMDYGAPDYLYLIPPEVGGIRMSLNSSLPIPRESWGECLELILGQYGIGVRQLNPFLKELYISRTDPSSLKGILEAREELDLYAPQARVCFILTPNSTNPRSDLLFLEKFSSPVTTKIEILGGKIFIIGSVETIQELLKLYTFANSGGNVRNSNWLLSRKSMRKRWKVS